MKEYEYTLSEQAFLDTWYEFDCPNKITDINTIHKFFDSLMAKTKGVFIVDHINGGNYDNVNSITYNKPYSFIIWKYFDKLRMKHLDNTINEDEKLHWYVFGCATYDYILCIIQKLRIKKVGNHLLVGILSYLTNIKEYQRWFDTKEYSLITIDDSKDFETDYIFWEGEPGIYKKHICRVNSLPFYTNLIQPKQNCCSSHDSTRLLIAFTHDEVIHRLNIASEKLQLADAHDIDSLFDIGNRVRRIIEYFLKYFSVHKGIKLGIIKNYHNLLLGDLKKKIKPYYPELIKQSIINTANELSHDSGKFFTKSEIQSFINEVTELADTMSEILLNDDE